MQAAEELKPQDPKVHARLAMVYDEAGDHRRADLERQTAERLAGSR